MKARPCADCLAVYPSHVMQFDHVRGEKVGDVGGMTSVPVGALLAEIDKCEVVCANCHADRTHRRRFPKQKETMEC